MGARCQSGCDEKRTREHAERTALNCGNREVPATGTLRGVGGEAFLPYPISALSTLHFVLRGTLSHFVTLPFCVAGSNSIFKGFVGGV